MGILTPGFMSLGLCGKAMGNGVGIRFYGTLLYRGRRIACRMFGRRTPGKMDVERAGYRICIRPMK